MDTAETKARNLKVTIENGEVLSLYTEELAIELQRMREVVRTIDNGKGSVEAQKLVKQITEAESNLGEALEQLDTFLLRLHKAT